MSFFDVLSRLDTTFPQAFSSRDVEKALTKQYLSEEDFLIMLSPAATPYLEDMAQRAHRETLKYFGRTMRVYTPLYISDYCENSCLYCGFNKHNQFPRRKLTLEEIEKEGEAIARKGFQDVLVLTGESRTLSPVSYIYDACRILRSHFPSLSVEIYPLNREEYATLHRAGVNGLTIYQETYDTRLYYYLHPSGPKKDFRFRLAAPERGGEGGLRWINIGVLLGLGDWRRDIYLLGLHARYLMEKFPHCEVGVGIPRLRPYLGNPFPYQMVTDGNLVQIICALRLFLPHLGISLTTRERPELRDNLIPLGITRISAASVTSVGGHSRGCDSDYRVPQFEIADLRSLEELMNVIRAKNYEPVTHDWIDDVF